jgi:hypothetical protein
MYKYKMKNMGTKTSNFSVAQETAVYLPLLGISVTVKIQLYQ